MVQKTDSVWGETLYVGVSLVVFESPLLDPGRKGSSSPATREATSGGERRVPQSRGRL